mmetsp:Transcript_69631/g.193789  ORF Transcript_69631/g.193789 Transcript_69631/m.193789 type:complete len:368 (-) Transcript_69631:31-1134(-)
MQPSAPVCHGRYWLDDRALQQQRRRPLEADEAHLRVGVYRQFWWRRHELSNALRGDHVLQFYVGGVVHEGLSIGSVVVPWALTAGGENNGARGAGCHGAPGVARARPGTKDRRRQRHEHRELALAFDLHHQSHEHEPRDGGILAGQNPVVRPRGQRAVEEDGGHRPPEERGDRNQQVLDSARGRHPSAYSGAAIGALPESQADADSAGFPRSHGEDPHVPTLFARAKQRGRNARVAQVCRACEKDCRSPWQSFLRRCLRGRCCICRVRPVLAPSASPAVRRVCHMPRRQVLLRRMAQSGWCEAPLASILRGGKHAIGKSSASEPRTSLVTRCVSPCAGRCPSPFFSFNVLRHCTFRRTLKLVSRFVS